MQKSGAIASEHGSQGEDKGSNRPPSLDGRGQEEQGWEEWFIHRGAVEA